MLEHATTHVSPVRMNALMPLTLSSSLDHTHHATLSLSLGPGSCDATSLVASALIKCSRAIIVSCARMRWVCFLVLAWSCYVIVSGLSVHLGRLSMLILKLLLARNEVVACSIISMV